MGDVYLGKERGLQRSSIMFERERYGILSNNSFACRSVGAYKY